MNNGWDDYEPAPLEFYHGRFMTLFHEWRISKTKDTSIMINGTDLNNIVAQAKRETYAKYPKNILTPHAVKKIDFK